MRERFNIVTMATTIALMLLSGAVAGTISFFAGEQNSREFVIDYVKAKETVTSIANVKEYIDKYYLGEYDNQVVMDASIEAMMGALGDNWSHYLTASEYTLYKKGNEQNAIGVGLSCSYDQDSTSLGIVDVHPESPARNAGIVPYDRLLAVDGVPVSKSGAAFAVNKLKGAPGTVVRLELLSQHSGQPYNVVLTRQAYSFSYVKSEILDGNIGYLRIKNFEPGSDKSFRDALNRLIDANVTSIVFDVRSNPGGKMDMMRAMLDAVLPECLTMIEKDRLGTETRYDSDVAGIDLPMVVLVNNNSYGAAEFFAAVLAEYGKARILGEKTPGTGYIQPEIPMEDGSALLMQSTSYLTPNGNNLSRVGLVPDLSVEMPFNDKMRLNTLNAKTDVQLAAAITALTAPAEVPEETPPEETQVDPVETPPTE